jgi:hypothetical protein
MQKNIFLSNYLCAAKKLIQNNWRNEMKKVVIALFVLSFSGIVTSCKREHHAFPYELRAYFPYVINQELTFVNDSNQFLSGRISYMHTSETQYLPYTCKCGDGFDSRMSVMIEADSLKFTGEMFTTKSSFLISCICELGGKMIGLDKEYNGDSFSGNFSKTVGDTVILEKGNNRMVVIKGKGIAEIKAGDDVWRLKE